MGTTPRTSLALVAPTRILITGAAGRIGRSLRSRLVQPDRLLRLLDIAELAPARDGERVELVQGSITDMPLMEQACQDVDAVIHLAGYSREEAWQRTFEVNIGGTYTVFEAARRQGVGRVVFASSSHVVGYAPREQAAAPDWLFPRPDTNYGVSKAAGEAIGSLYADRYGMDVICVRIGACFGHPGHPRLLGIWLSPDDCGRLFDACLCAPQPGFRVVWGVSANTRRSLSLAEAERLGYQPCDDSEKFAEELAAHFGGLEDERTAERLGADWCGPELDTARIEHGH
jgi:uronate dehydrogenase